jgi:hypothetical protein
MNIRNVAVLSVLSAAIWWSTGVHARCADQATTSDFNGSWVLIDEATSPWELNITLDRNSPVGHIGKIGTWSSSNARTGRETAGFLYGRCFQDELQFTPHFESERISRMQPGQIRLQLIGDKQMAGTSEFHREGVQSAYAYRKQGWRDVASASIPLEQASLEGTWLVWGGRNLDIPEELGLRNPGGDLGQWERPISIRLNGSRLDTDIGEGSVASIDGTGKDLRINLRNAGDDYVMLYRNPRRPGLMTGFVYSGSPRSASEYAEYLEPVMMFRSPGTVVVAEEKPRAGYGNLARLGEQRGAAAVLLGQQSQADGNRAQPGQNENNACRSAFSRYKAQSQNSLVTTNPDRYANRLCIGAENSTQPVQCFSMIMSGEVSWGGGYNWEPGNALDLCEGTLDASQTLACFTQTRGASNSWRQGIRTCSHNGYSFD